MTPEQTLDWLAEQHKSQCNEDRPVQEWIRSMKSMLPAVQDVPETNFGNITKDEALDKALYALEIEDVACRYMKDETPSQIMEAITAIKQARSAPVQEPVVFYRCNGCGHAYEQVHPTSCDCMEAGGFDRVEYYTTPPAAQRQWVPVTKELLSAQHPWLYESMWIAMKDGSVMSGHYAWMQGRYPDRFLVGDCASLWAFEATHVMPMNQPKHPASEKGQP